MSARIGSAWKKFRELSGVLVGKQGLSLKQGLSSGVVVKIEDMKIQSCLRWNGHVMHGDINSQICEIMGVEITGKSKKRRPRKSWEECVKKDLE